MHAHIKVRKTLEQYWWRSHFLPTLDHEFLQGEAWILLWRIGDTSSDSNFNPNWVFLSLQFVLVNKTIIHEISLDFFRCVSAALDWWWKLNKSKFWLDAGRGAGVQEWSSWSRGGTSYKDTEHMSLTMAKHSWCREMWLVNVEAKALTF